jgi:MFS family permease
MADANTVQPTLDPESREPQSRVRYFVVAVSLLMSVLLYLDRFCVSFASDYIREDLDLTQSQIAGMISIFFWSYALAQVPSGWLSDRYGSRIMLTLYIVIWSIFTMLTGVVSGLFGLLIMRAGCGLGQAGAYPTSASVISKWIPLTGRAAASSIVALGGRCGGALAPLLTAFLMVLFVPISSDGTSDLLEPADILHSGRLSHNLAPAASSLPENAPQGEPTSEPAQDVATPQQRAWQFVTRQLEPADRRAILATASRYRQMAARQDTQRKQGEPITADPTSVTLDPATTGSLVTALNSLLDDADFFDEPIHQAVNLPRQGQDLQASHIRAESLFSVPLPQRRSLGLSVAERRRFHRLLLEASFRDDIRKIYVAGWRPVMYVFGALGFLVAGIYWLIIRNHPTQHPRCNQSELDRIAEGRSGAAAGAENAVGAAPLIPLIKSFSMWCDCFMQLGGNVAWMFLVTWLARYLADVHDVPILQRGLLASIPLAAGTIGMLTGGKATDLLTARIGLKWGRRWPLFGTKITGAAAYGCCLLFSTFPADSPLNSAVAMTICFCVVSFSIDFGNPANWAFKQDVGGRHVGSVLGWGNMWGNIGAACSPLIYDAVLGENPTHGDWNNMLLVCLVAFIFSGVCALGIDASKPIVSDDDQP